MIVILRHPVVVSLATTKWTPTLVSRNGRVRTSLPSLVSHWIKAHEVLRDDAPHIERLHVLRYEDLVSDPDTELRTIQLFLGLDTPDPQRHSPAWGQRPIRRAVGGHEEGRLGRAPPSPCH